MQSSVFRDGAELGAQEPKITFTDLTIETADRG